MTKIVIYQGREGIKGFKSQGHAGFGVRGTDVVCASISMLCINTMNSIEKITSDQFDQKINERKATIEFWMDNPSHDSQVLLQSLKLGLEGVAKDYPGNVTIQIEEV